MKTNPLFVLPASLLALLVAPMSAQTGTPVLDPPTPPPTPSVRAVDPEAARATESALSLTDASNSTGKSSGNGTVKELRFSAVDADADGFVSLSEFTTFMDAGSQARSGERNAAGVSPSETLFGSIDQNRDNLLSEKEVTAYQDEQDRAKR